MLSMVLDMGGQAMVVDGAVLVVGPTAPGGDGAVIYGEDLALVLGALITNLNPLSKDCSMELIPKEHALFLYKISKVGLFTGSLGIYCGHLWLGSGVIVGAALARNYWRNPVYGWRRRLDMAWVQVLIWSHLWNVLGNDVQMIYLTIQLLGVWFYYQSWIYQHQNNYWLSTYYHAGVHLCSHASLVYFYLSTM